MKALALYIGFYGLKALALSRAQSAMTGDHCNSVGSEPIGVGFVHLNGG